jgi:methylated-DNA-[protein]-cysteine S-methyltransferase
MQYFIIDSLIGKLLLVGDAQALRRVSLQDGSCPIRCDSNWVYDESPFREAISQLEAYFAGELRTFTLKLKPQGTVFQQRVWEQLQAIPYGETASYGEIAQAIGNPQASRAVGAANGKNPLPIVIPCHRVIGSSGNLVGYSCGLNIKEDLLSLERRYADKDPQPCAIQARRGLGTVRDGAVRRQVLR